MVYLHLGAPCSYISSMASKIGYFLFEKHKTTWMEYFKIYYYVFLKHKKTNIKHKTKHYFSRNIGKTIVHVRHSIPIWMQRSKETSTSSISSKSPRTSCWCTLTLRPNVKMTREIIRETNIPNSA